MKYLFLIGCLFLQNCAPINHSYKLQIPQEVMPHIVQFEYEALMHGKNIRITDLVVEFKPELGDAIGLCYYGNETYTPKIELARWWWNFSSYEEREVLIFHELGHCILERKHNYDTDDLGNPKSIMFPFILSQYIYETNKLNLLQELFGHVRLY